jgi:hypothetical protein
VNVAEVVNQVEATGSTFRVDEAKVRVWYPGGVEQRQELIREIAFLRAYREEVARFLQDRAIVPEMPPGIRLIHWKLKEPPVAIDSCSIVTGSARFARTTLEQLRIALTQPKRWVGWSVPQLIDRLAQVGVVVALETVSQSK